MSEPDKVSLDYLLVADGAQVVGGKLYLLGGGWDRVVVPQLPGRPATPFSVAVGINVPWSLTNRKMTFSVDVLDADGGHIDTLAAGGFEVGRPTGLRAGASQRFQLAGPAAPVFPTAGRYVVQCAVDGEVLGHTVIEVSAASPAASPA
ncbi:MAG: hypothetical protein WCN81_12385 [Actinomycetes bacterium]